MSLILSIVLKSKWTWIVVSVLILTLSIYGFSRYQASKYEKIAAALKISNEKLKNDAKIQEAQFVNKMNSMSTQAFEINKKLTILKKDNENLAKQNVVLIKKSTELEAKYAELQKKYAEIKVPASRADRVILLLRLGY